MAAPAQGIHMLRGKRREFIVGLLLTIVTFGIYPAFWHYMAFKELHDQENQDDFPIMLFIGGCLPLLHFVCQPLFMSEELDFVNELRQRHGLQPTMGIVEFLLWMTLGQLIVVGPLIAYARLQGAINELWDSYRQLPTTSIASRATAAE
jgi:hypothetical protein